MNIANYHKSLTQKLESIGSDTAQMDAQLLICHYMDYDLTDFLLNQHHIIANNILAKLNRAEQLAIQHMPISRIVNMREFWGLKFYINQHVLDPRADSEILIESLLHFIPQTQTPLHLLDLGTGSGCLILALLHEYQKATSVAVDYSPNALKIATQNAKQLGLDTRCHFLQSNWFSNIPPQKFDVIIANPPYIPSHDIHKLAKNVKAYDPLTALDGGNTGLEAYKTIINQAPNYLKPNGILIFEMGYDQADPLFKLLAENGFTSNMFDMQQIANQQFAKNITPGLAYDLGGNPRMIISKYAS